jgi:hypothetical protein
MHLNLYYKQIKKTTMKKSIALVAAAFGVSSVFAQDLTSKKGEPFLPEAGDWAVSIDATPFLNYAGNFFGKTTANAAPTWNNYGLNQSITGKYFKDATTAYRATIRVGFDNGKKRVAINEYVAPTAVTEALGETKEQKYDQMKVSSRNIVLGIGMEKRKGKTRLQGIYGGDLLVWGGNLKESYKYANGLTQTNDAATTFNENLDADDASGSTNFGANAISGFTTTSNVATSLDGYANVDAARALSRKTNGRIGIGIRAFIGAEYFILPKISIGGEFGWGIGYQLNTKDKSTWDAEGTSTAAGSTQIGKEIKVKDSVNGGSNFILDTDRNASNSNTYNLMGGSGTIRLTFHF